MPGAVYPGLAAGQHSPMCLASGPVCCYKDHLCSWLNQLPHLEFLMAWWERVERRSCVAALPKYALTIHSLHQLLGWKDLEQSTFVKCQKIMSVGTRKGGSFTETSSYLAGRLYKSWDLRSGHIWGLFWASVASSVAETGMQLRVRATALHRDWGRPAGVFRPALIPPSHPAPYKTCRMILHQAAAAQLSQPHLPASLSPWQRT